MLVGALSGHEMLQASRTKNERRYRRVPQYLPVDLRTISIAPSTGIPLRGVLTDLGISGLHVLLGSPYHPGCRFEVTVILAGDTLTFCAVVRHVRWFSSTPGMMYGHGLQITEIDEASLYKIVDYLTEEMALLQRGSGRRAA